MFDKDMPTTGHSSHNVHVVGCIIRNKSWTSMGDKWK